MGSIDEDATRMMLVEKALREAGWPVVDFVKGRRYGTVAVKEYETAEGPADYILFDNGEAIAAVEAKRLGLGPQNVLSQCSTSPLLRPLLHN